MTDAKKRSPARIAARGLVPDVQAVMEEVIGAAMKKASGTSVALASICLVLRDGPRPIWTVARRANIN